MQQNARSVSMAAPGVLATNKVIRNTYMLLALTIMFSAVTAFISTVFALPMPIWAFLIGYLGLLMLVMYTANSAFGLVSVFLFSGFMGLTLGPILNAVIQGFSNGPEIVTAALASTGAIFFALSGYAMTTRKDFSYLGGFIFVGLIVTLLASIALLFFQIPALEVVISAAMVLLMGGYLLFQTSQLIHGGETNYIMATIGLYVTLYNLFISLINLLSIFAGRRE